MFRRVSSAPVCHDGRLRDADAGLHAPTCIKDYANRSRGIPPRNGENLLRHAIFGNHEVAGLKARHGTAGAIRDGQRKHNKIRVDPKLRWPGVTVLGATNYHCADRDKEHSGNPRCR